jgi:cbb3-type cytochrome oxidase subunit 3
MRKAIKKINETFITIVLFIFYFLVIGFSFFIYRLLNKKKINKETYWEDVEKKQFTKEYFQSTY